MNDYFLDFSAVEFECPYCGTEYSDKDEKLYNRIKSNKNPVTSMNCENCGERFGVTFDVTGDMVGFKLEDGCQQKEKN